MLTARLKILSVQKDSTYFVLRLKALELPKASFPIESLKPMLYLSKSREFENLINKYITIKFNYDNIPIAFAFNIDDRLKCWYDITSGQFKKNKDMFL